MIRKIAVLLTFGCLWPALGVSQEAQVPVTLQAVPTDTTTSAGPSPLRLEDLVREALQMNPAVRSALHTVEAQRRRVPQAKTLPDPTVGIGWAGNIRPFSVQSGDPSSYRAVAASQQLLYPGKLKLRGEIASKEADAASSDLEAIRRRVTADVKTVFFEYWFYDKAIQTTLKDKDLLTKLSQIAEARYRVGKGVQQDVLRSQVEISLLLQRLTVLQQQRNTSQARLNTRLARSPEAQLPPAENIERSPLNYSLDDLYRLARRNDPGLHREEQMIERNQLAVNLAQKDYYPDLSVAYMYQQRPMLPDMQGMTFTVNIPVFYKSKQREEVRQATEERLSAESGRDNRQNELNFELKQQYLAAKASDELLRLFSEGVVPQSSLALESNTPSGAQIPLGQIADISLKTGPGMIRDENGRLSGYVYVDVSGRDIGSYVTDAKKVVAEKVSVPAGYQLVWSGQYESMERVKERLKIVLPITLFIVFLLLYFNTKSTVKTFIILLAVPFSAIGAIWFLYLLNYNMSIAVWVGLIALLGVDAETAVFMLLYLDLAYHDAISKGRMNTWDDLREAIVVGAVKRLRPKVMTVACMLFGLLPIMWSVGSGGDVMKRIAAPMIGGIITSFLMELIIYPPVFAIWKWNFEVKPKLKQ